MASTGRGAKGSINDRLISQLYRERYRKRKLKKETYTIAGKKQQKVYLTNLKAFNETKNVDILDYKDKSKLDDIKIVLNPVVVNEIINEKPIDTLDEKIEEISKEKEYTGIDFFERDIGIKEDTKVVFEDNQIEDVDIEEEEKKVDLEEKIMDEVLVEIDKNIKKAVNIKSQMNELTEKISETNDKDKIEEYRKQYDKLLKELNELKMKYHIMREKYKFDDYQVIENYTLNKSIDDYKSKSNIEELEMLVSFCKEESEQMMHHVIDPTVQENKNIVNEKEKQVNEDYKTVEIINESMNYREIENALLDEAVRQAKIIADIESRMYKIADKVTVSSFDVNGLFQMFGSLFRIAAGFVSMPVSAIAPNRLGSSLMKNGINKMNKISFYKDKDQYRYFDLSDEITEGKTKLENAQLFLETAMDEILMTEYNFKTRFSKYADVIPEYSNIIDKINDIKNFLSKKAKEFEEYSLKLEKAKDNNNNKVKVKA